MRWALVGRDDETSRALKLIRSGTGFTVVGPAGVGKSRLLDEVLQRADQFRTTFRVVATEATGKLPLSPFASLLPPTTPGQNRLQMLTTTRQGVEELGDSRGVVVGIDDAQHLDETSLALLATLVSSDTVTLALTVRDDIPLAPGLVSLWKDEHLERIGLGPLDRNSTETLVEMALDGQVGSALKAELWRLTEGNPLLLREIIEGTSAEHIDRDEKGIWRLKVPLSRAPALGEMVRSRLRKLPKDLRAALEVVAIGHPLSMDLAAEVVGDEPLMALEAIGLVAIRPMDGFQSVEPVHPLYGEILVAHMGEHRWREASRSMARATATKGLSPPVDALRAAIWQRDSGVVEDSELALAGAVLALTRHDALLAEELVRPIADKPSRAGPALVLGRALNYQGRYDEAESVLAGTEASDDSTMAEVALARAHNLAFGLQDVELAKDLLEEAAKTVDDDIKGQLDSERGMIAAIRGNFTETIEASRAVLDNRSASDVASTTAWVNLGLAQSMTGDCTGSEATFNEGFESTRALKSQLPMAEDQMLLQRVDSEIASGRVVTGIDLARRRLAQVDEGSGLYPTWLARLSTALFFHGLLKESLQVASRSVRQFENFDPFRLKLQTQGLVALVAGQLGDAAPGQTLADVQRPMQEPRIDLWLDRGKAWGLAASGAISTAAELVAQSGREGLTRQHVTWGAWALHDATRMGRPDLVGAELEEASRLSNGALLTDVMRDHTLALAAEDNANLLTIARRFGSLGANLLAAESAAQAALGFGSENRLEQAARSEFIFRTFDTRCQPSATPSLAQVPNILTDREFEIAMLAAQGMSSPEIARPRYISPRTVNNHLGSVYRKLGVSGRTELAALLHHAAGNDVDFEDISP